MTSDGGANLGRSTRYYGPDLDAEAWFRVADRDYVELVGGVDWGAFFGRSTSPRALLDIGCGTGRFPELLAGSGMLPREPVRYDYLDPSDHCLELLPAALREPFRAGTAYRTTLASSHPEVDAAGRYDLIWCIHSLYTTEPEALPGALAGLVPRLKPSHGQCLVYIAEPSSFYIRFHQRYLAVSPEGTGRSFTHAGHVRDALREGGIAFDERPFNFPHMVERSDHHVLGAYLSGCTFDRRSADAWVQHPELGPFLEGFAQGSRFVFPQQVTLFTLGC